ncbi:MAG: hypothetical protein Q9217_005906 [Psora testacea]
MSLVLGLAVFAAFASAKTLTSCNPLDKTCPPNPALSTNHTFDFTTSIAGSTWNTSTGPITYTDDGAAFTINRDGDAPTITTKFYLFFGQVEVWMQAAPGKGIASSIVLQSDDLDAIGWEIIGGNATHAENNYYGKGNTTGAFERAKWYPMPSPPQNDLHNYTTSWTKDQLNWYLDGNLVRTLRYEDANGGAGYPQTPMQLKLGVCAAGDSANNNNYTVQWADGGVDYSKGPFTMWIKSARVTDFGSGKEYKYKDNTGMWQSIDVVAGNSSAADTLSAGPSQTVRQRWEGLSKEGKIAVGSTVGAVALLGLSLFSFFFFKQRRRGKRERAAAEAAYEKDTTELLQYKAQGGKGWDTI